MPGRLLRRVKELLDASRDLIAESQQLRQKAERLAKERHWLKPSTSERAPDDSSPPRQSSE